MTERFGGASVTPAEFRVGAAIDQAFAVFRARPVPFLVLAAIGTLVPLVVGLVLLSASANPAVIGLVNTLLQVTVTFLIQGAIIHGAFKQMQREPFSVGSSISQCMPRLFPLIGASLLAGLIIVIGFVLFVVPGMIAFVMLYVAAAVCIVEGLGPIESLGRSRQLTKGYRWKIFAILLLLFVVFVVGSTIIGLILRPLSVTAISLVIGFVWQVIGYAFSSILVAVVYTRLRIIKEGLTLRSIASVFD